MVVYGMQRYPVPVSELWEFDGVRWSRAQFTLGPPPRRGGSLVYDAARQVTLLFGGDSPWNTYDDRLWLWDGASWQSVAPSPRPSVRTSHTMTYDSQRQRAVLFGGWGNHPPTPIASINPQGSQTVVTLREPHGYVDVPAQLSIWIGNVVGNDPDINGRHYNVSFPNGYSVALPIATTTPGSGGTVSVDDTQRQDTWEWDGSRWIFVDVPRAPPARFSSGLSYDSRRQRTVLFGGQFFDAPANGYRLLGDTWEYDGVTWTPRQVAVRPSARACRNGLVYHQALGESILVGSDHGSMSDMWRFDGATWSLMRPSYVWGGEGIAYDPNSAHLIAIPSTLENGFYEFSPVAIDILDAKDFALPDTMQVTSDHASLASGGVVRGGAVADGVSQLLLRLETPTSAPITVSMTGTTGEDGLLGIPAGPFQTTPLVLTPDPPQLGMDHKAYALFKAPLDFVRPGQNRSSDESSRTRTVQVRVDTPLPYGTAHDLIDVHLTRPPVVLAHGLWSSPAAWDGAFASLAYGQDPRFLTHVMDYSATHAKSFQTNAPAVGRAVAIAVQQARGWGFACSQVDWVGHSMGGVLPRVYYENGMARHGRPWQRADNFGAGDIHKLIILNSPQSGSPLAELAVAAKNHAFWGRIYDAAMRSDPFGPALVDLQEGSPAYAAIGTTRIPSAAIVGTGGELLVGNVSRDLRQFAGLCQEPYRSLLRFVGHALPIASHVVFRGQEHDTVVLEASQQGGLSASHYQTVATLDSVHTSVTNSPSPDYFQRVVALLNSPVASFAPSLPPPDLNPRFGPPGGSASPATLGLSMVNQPPFSTTPGFVHLVITPTGGFQPAEVDVFSPWGFITAQAPSWSVVVPVPAVAAGLCEFIAIGRDSQGNAAVSTVLTVDVGVTGTLQSIYVVDSQISLSAPYERVRLVVMGEFDNAIERNVSDPRWGTTYASSDPSVATVSSDGTITALAPGNATIQISNGLLLASAYVEVALDVVTGFGSGTTGSGGFVPRISTNGQSPRLGNSGFEVQVANVLGGAPGIMLVGWDAAELPIQGVMLNVSPGNMLALGAQANGSVNTPGAGVAVVPTAIPNDASLDGLRVYWQGVFLDSAGAGGLSASWGLVTTLYR